MNKKGEANEIILLIICFIIGLWISSQMQAGCERLIEKAEKDNKAHMEETKILEKMSSNKQLEKCLMKKTIKEGD